ncbi:phosphodiester glycosidase family protein [Limnofasciculus baicalensis]|uniref:Phosphodiester glycosidase family protein n=1 Tax=Limnofasciculus baicalensis BBK-W-15 TaxID=2699891 RepID=A0AAE3GUG3_9CYAN|nr:phosphodiester glycosidase family protein [Limnofasciculus baicalensis]MCP2728782.1 phosphodiester glycosidase family protein [Limnofasciculus baicalensis BBK-W-15]
MPKPQQTNGFRKIMRRSFLVMLGLITGQVLAEYFAIPQNRNNFFKLLSQTISKLLALKSPSSTDVTPQPIKTTPILTPSPPQKKPLSVKASPTPKSVASQKSPELTKGSQKKARPIQVSRKTIAGVSFYQTTIDLNDPETFITIGLANNATMANTMQVTNGDESFEKMVARYQAAVVVNGTFFGKDEKEAVLGNMVAGGKFLKYSRWENYGTTLGLKAGKKLEMVTARKEGKPEWNQHWFSITCGPRLLKEGQLWLAPLSEGFKDSHVLNEASRSAIGFDASGSKLFLVTFLSSLSLKQEADIMKAIGCFEAMNLDGGASLGLAHKRDILVSPGRNLTNVIVVYDKEFPAPAALKLSWQRFQNGGLPAIPN